jgi:hypothetical protein
MYYLQENKMYKITQDNNLNLQFHIEWKSAQWPMEHKLSNNNSWLWFEHSNINN